MKIPRPLRKTSLTAHHPYTVMNTLRTRRDAGHQEPIDENDMYESYLQKVLRPRTSFVRGLMEINFVLQGYSWKLFGETVASTAMVVVMTPKFIPWERKYALGIAR